MNIEPLEPAFVPKTNPIYMELVLPETEGDGLLIITRKYDR